MNYSHIFRIATRTTLGAVVAFALGVTSYALDMGQPKINSYLEEPLSIVVPVSGHAAKVRLAPAAEYLRLGYEKPSFALNVNLDNRGDDMVLRISSQEVVNEPSFSVLIESEVDKQRKIIEIPVLLDPRPTEQPEGTIAKDVPIVESNTATNLNKQVGDATAANTKATGHVVVLADGKNQILFELTDQTYGPTSEGEKLATIANKVKPSGYKPALMERALQAANPQAIVNGQVKSGIVLKIPNLRTRKTVAAGTVTAPAVAAVPLDPPAMAKTDTSAAVKVASAEDRTTATPVPNTAATSAAVKKQVQYKMTGKTYGPVKAQETLWSIANAVRPQGYKTQVMVDALRATNSQAFSGGQLKAGAVLKIPDLKTRTTVEVPIASPQTTNNASQTVSPPHTEPADVTTQTKAIPTPAQPAAQPVTSVLAEPELATSSSVSKENNQAMEAITEHEQTAMEESDIAQGDADGVYILEELPPIPDGAVSTEEPSGAAEAATDNHAAVPDQAVREPNAAVEQSTPPAVTGTVPVAAPIVQEASPATPAAPQAAVVSQPPAVPQTPVVPQVPVAPPVAVAPQPVAAPVTIVPEPEMSLMDTAMENLPLLGGGVAVLLLLILIGVKAVQKIKQNKEAKAALREMASMEQQAAAQAPIIPLPETPAPTAQVEEDSVFDTKGLSLAAVAGVGTRTTVQLTKEPAPASVGELSFDLPSLTPVAEPAPVSAPASVGELSFDLPSLTPVAEPAPVSAPASIGELSFDLPDLTPVAEPAPASAPASIGELSFDLPSLTPVAEAASAPASIGELSFDLPDLTPVAETVPASAPASIGELSFDLPDLTPAAEVAPTSAPASTDEFSFDLPDLSSATAAAAVPIAAPIESADEFNFDLPALDESFVATTSAISSKELDLDFNLPDPHLKLPKANDPEGLSTFVEAQRTELGDVVFDVDPMFESQSSARDQLNLKPVAAVDDFDIVLEDAVEDHTHTLFQLNSVAPSVPEPIDDLDLDDLLVGMQQATTAADVSLTEEQLRGTVAPVVNDDVPESESEQIKLELAQAYLELGDVDGAKSLLDEVIAEGGTKQIAQARALLEQLG